MSKTIWKYPLTIPSTLVEMPMDADILTVQMQDKNPVLWCRVNSDTKHPSESREFVFVGTGRPLPDAPSYEYIGTIQQSPFAWHLYEVWR